MTEEEIFFKSFCVYKHQEKSRQFIGQKVWKTWILHSATCFHLTLCYTYCIFKKYFIAHCLCDSCEVRDTLTHTHTYICTHQTPHRSFTCTARGHRHHHLHSQTRSLTPSHLITALLTEPELSDLRADWPERKGQLLTMLIFLQLGSMLETPFWIQLSRGRVSSNHH